MLFKGLTIFVDKYDPLTDLTDSCDIIGMLAYGRFVKLLVKKSQCLNFIILGL